MSTSPTLPHQTAVSSSANDRALALHSRLHPLRQRLSAHPVYGAIQSLPHLHIFMRSHVFAVWDFMSLLKALQRGLTCVDVPWVPSPAPQARRFINEIVLREESDLYEAFPVSHFELYLRAMQQCGASTEPIEDVLFQLGQGEGIDDVLARVPVPEPARRFVRSTFSFIQTGQLHIIAAAFTLGREDPIPDLFKSSVRDQDAQLSGRLSILRWYLDRHVEADTAEHGHLALRLIATLCGSNDIRWHEAETAATQALEARITLWDGILAQINHARTTAALTGTHPPVASR